MSRRSTSIRCPWEDRFRTPAVEELREGLGGDHTPLFDHVRERLRTQGLDESLAWNGVPWRWSLVYRADAATIAYLVPQPGKPMIALVLPAAQLASLPVRKMSRTVRDGIIFSARVGGMHWPTWEITSKTLADEVVGLLRSRAAGVTATA